MNICWWKLMTDNVGIHLNMLNYIQEIHLWVVICIWFSQKDACCLKWPIPNIKCFMRSTWSTTKSYNQYQIGTHSHFLNIMFTRLLNNSCPQLTSNDPYPSLITKVVLCFMWYNIWHIHVVLHIDYNIWPILCLQSFHSLIPFNPK